MIYHVIYHILPCDISPDTINTSYQKLPFGSPDIWPMYHLIPVLNFAILCDVLDYIHSSTCIISPWLGPVPNRWTTDSVSTICARYVLNIHVRHSSKHPSPRGYIAWCWFRWWWRLDGDDPLTTFWHSKHIKHACCLSSTSKRNASSSRKPRPFC